MFNRETTPFTGQDDQRIFLLSTMTTLIFFLLSFRLFHLQVVRGPEMSRLSDQNKTQVIPLLAARGRVFDRTGEMLLDNAPRFSLYFSYNPSAAVPMDSVKADIIRWLPGHERVIARKMAVARQTGKMTRLMADVPRPVALALLERRVTLPGLNVIAEPRRRARFGAFASHLLGYVDEVDVAELARYRDRGYRGGQLIGKAGIEKSYDTLLRGQDGGLQFEMDAAGRHVQMMQRIPSTPGADLTLTIDRRLQEAAEEGLAHSITGRGAAVGLDPRTGAVLFMASAPDFDPTENLSDFLADESRPLLNRTLQGIYPPGSIFKIVTAAAVLENVGWDLKRVINCTGVFKLGNKEFGCWSKHGRQDFFGAVAWSCNVYFYNLGLAVGPDLIEGTARAFGFGQKTGIDLPTESAGVIPSRAWKKRVLGEGWFDGDTLNFCIGQGAVAVTPLQAVRMLAAVANGGALWKPYIVQEAVDADGKKVFARDPEAERTIVLKPEVWDTLHHAMEGVVRTGSGRGVFRPDLTIGAKTGTAQNPHGENHSWFSAYAGRPGEAPSLALVIFVENGGQGSVAAGPIARAIIDAAFPVLPQIPKGRKS